MSQIILVDDDEAVRVIVRLALVRFGHEVREAVDGREAMKLCAESPPDLIVTDLIMPGQEGIETIGLVRRRFPNVRIIAMSGGGRVSATDYLQTALAIGADDGRVTMYELRKLRRTDLLPPRWHAGRRRAGVR